MSRRYQMTRVAPGEYMVPSNDGKTLWLVSRYSEDGHVVELLPDGRERRVREAWSVHRFVGTPEDATRYAEECLRRASSEDDFLREFLWSRDRWDEWSFGHRTRKEALASIFEKEAS